MEQITRFFVFEGLYGNNNGCNQKRNQNYLKRNKLIEYDGRQQMNDRS